MIVPMKKVSLVTMEKDQVNALERLRAVGVVHLERRPAASDELSKLMDSKNKADVSMGTLRSYKLAKKTPELSKKPDDLVKATLDSSDERKAAQEQLAILTKERSRLEKWGDFNPQGFADLEAGGVRLIPYELSAGAFNAIPRETPLIILSRDKNAVRLLTWNAEIPGEISFAIPADSLSDIDRKMGDLNKRLAEIDQELLEYAYQTDRINQELLGLQGKIEFETARAGMEIDDCQDMERGNASFPYENFALSWIVGYVPEADLGAVKRAASENGWALLAEDPGPDDNVPTKLKNNGFASLIYPLTNYLEVTPGYNEVDISGWFLFFFIIFVGMIFGDAGYGVVLLLAGFIGVAKTIKKGVPAALKLLLLMGTSNLIWGTLTCSWFGADVTKLPAFLRAISLPLISNVTSNASAEGAGLVQQNLMIVCFSLALLQLSIGHILAIMQTRSLKILGDIGSILMLGGMYGIVLSLIASNEYRQIPMYMPAVYAFGVGFVLNFVFINYDGAVGGSILESCKNIISVILGIANVFSDIMSYIRLWAVGLAGASIASTVNSMAGPMLGHFLFFIFGVALLTFGHGLNLVLNALSVLVHGVRLNTLEFSGHAGLTWAGTAYKPFAEKGKK